MVICLDAAWGSRTATIQEPLITNGVRHRRAQWDPKEICDKEVLQ